MTTPTPNPGFSFGTRTRTTYTPGRASVLKLPCPNGCGWQAAYIVTDVNITVTYPDGRVEEDILTSVRIACPYCDYRTDFVD